MCFPFPHGETEFPAPKFYKTAEQIAGWLWKDVLVGTSSRNKYFQSHEDETAVTLTLVTDVGELSLGIPKRMRAAAVSAQGLARFTLTDADGYRWVCELLPVDADGVLQFRGIATGTKAGGPTEVFLAYAR